MSKLSYNPYALTSTQAAVEGLLEDQRPYDTADNPYLVQGHALFSLGRPYNPYQTSPVQPSEQQQEETSREPLCSSRWIDRGSDHQDRPRRPSTELQEDFLDGDGRHPGQDYNKLRSQCLQTRSLFQDRKFPATDRSIFYSRSPPRNISWLRPHEIVRRPQFISDDVSRFDVVQGELGDCWLLAAVANLTLNHELFVRVVPENQDFGHGYAGIFRFRFWQYGEWVEIVVDDRLPTYKGQLMFMHSADNHEFWSALLEKAYAKLHGSYEALRGGTTCEAMEDFSGGLTELYDVHRPPRNLFQIMMKAHERRSLMGCSMEPDPAVFEAELPNGLIRGHAYSITRVCLADIETPRVSGRIPMIRIRNPWGNDAEWRGPFSDSSPEWRYISEATKRELGLTFDADGEFWMTFKDFCSNFQRLEICNLSPDSLEEEDHHIGRKRWQMSVFEGCWERGSSAGGCRNYISTFSCNPQYTVCLSEPDDGGDSEQCTVIVALMQKHRRSQRRLGLDCLTIGFSIYRLPDRGDYPKPLDTDFFRRNTSVARAPSFINLREVSCRFQLPPGLYCIVPSTFQPHQQGHFIIRVFSERRSNMREHDQQLASGQIADSIRPQVDAQSEYDQKVREFFDRIAGDDNQIDWKELKQVLDFALKREFEFDGFSKDTVRSMIALTDSDGSGLLSLPDFRHLWQNLMVWKTVFSRHDRDCSGRLSGFELRTALNEAGYRLNGALLNALMRRYGDTDGQMAIDEFIACAVKVKACVDVFRSCVRENPNSATFSLQEWMRQNI